MKSSHHRDGASGVSSNAGNDSRSSVDTNTLAHIHTYSPESQSNVNRSRRATTDPPSFETACYGCSTWAREPDPDEEPFSPLSTRCRASPSSAPSSRLALHCIGLRQLASAGAATVTQAMSATAVEILPYVTVLVQSDRSTREQSTSGVSAFLVDSLLEGTRQSSDEELDDADGGDQVADGVDVDRRTSTYGDNPRLFSFNFPGCVEETHSASSFKLAPGASVLAAQQPRRHCRGTSINADLGIGVTAVVAATTTATSPSRGDIERQQTGVRSADVGDANKTGGGGGVHDMYMYDSLLERLAPVSPRLGALPRSAWLDLDAVSAAVVADLGGATAAAASGDGGSGSASDAARGVASPVQGAGHSSWQPTPPATPSQISQQSALAAPPSPLPPLSPLQPQPQQQPTVEGLARQVHSLQELVASLVGALRRMPGCSHSSGSFAQVAAAAEALSSDSPGTGRSLSQHRRIGQRAPVSHRRWAVQAGAQAEPTAAAAAAAANVPTGLPVRSDSLPVGRACWPLPPYESLTMPQTSLPLPSTPEAGSTTASAMVVAATAAAAPVTPVSRRSAFEQLASPPSFIRGTPSLFSATAAATAAAETTEAAANGTAGGLMSRPGSWESHSGLPPRLLSAQLPPPPPRLSLPGPGELHVSVATSPPLICSPSGAVVPSFWVPEEKEEEEEEEEGSASAGASAAATPTAFAARSPFSSSLRMRQCATPPVAPENCLRGTINTIAINDEVNSRCHERNPGRRDAAQEHMFQDFSPDSPNRRQQPHDQSLQRVPRRSVKLAHPSQYHSQQKQKQQKQQEAFPGASRILCKRANDGARAASASAAKTAAVLRRSLEHAHAAARGSRRVVFGDEPAFHEARKAYIRKWQACLQERNENRWVRRLLAPDISSDSFTTLWQGPSPTLANAAWAAATATAQAAATLPTAASNGGATAAAETSHSSMTGLCREADVEGGGGGVIGGGWCTPRRRALYVERMVDSAVDALAVLFASYGAPLGLTKLAPYTYGLDNRRLRLKMLPDGRLAVRCGSGWEELTLALAKLPLPRDSAARLPAPLASPPALPPAAAATAFGGCRVGVTLAANASPATMFQWP